MRNLFDRKFMLEVIRKIILGKPTSMQMEHFRIIKSLKKGEVAIDCGANVGKITELICKTGATVYAFEPNPFAFDVLKNRCANKQNVTVLNKAVWDKNQTIELFLHEDAESDQVKHSSGSSLLSGKTNVSKEYILTEAISLVDFIQSLNKPVALIKMDVEGAECAILEDLINTGVISRIGKILVETHEKKNPDLIEPTNKIRKLIKEKGLSNIDLSWF